MLNTFQYIYTAYNVQLGLAYDVTGLGNYVDPNKFVDGRVGYQNIPGEKKNNSTKNSKLFLGCCTSENCKEEWCNVDGQPIPTHVYIIIRISETQSFNALLPWRSNQQESASCRVANENECR